mmetsp:Transcript_65085/g.167523  ORF Transcript_65085/g.167523 Transcript_65085/m.167523 type:complete len:382 (-) Transcript_65085:754-1899(-)
MHSSLPFCTAVAMEASWISTSSSSPSESSPMVTGARHTRGSHWGGRGLRYSRFTSAFSALTVSRLTLGGCDGGRGPPPPPSSSLTSSLLTRPPGGGREGGRGPSAFSSSSSALMAIRLARGANLRRKTRSRSSCPRRILTAARASTVPARASTKSWYCSTLPHSSSRLFTEARKVAAETSSSPSAAASSSCGVLATGSSEAVRARLDGGWAGAAAAAASASSPRLSIFALSRCLTRSARDIGTAARDTGTSATPGCLMRTPAPRVTPPTMGGGPRDLDAGAAAGASSSSDPGGSSPSAWQNEGELQTWAGRRRAGRLMSSHCSSVRRRSISRNLMPIFTASASAMVPTPLHSARTAAGLHAGSRAWPCCCRKRRVLNGCIR